MALSQLVRPCQSSPRPRVHYEEAIYIYTYTSFLIMKLERLLQYVDKNGTRLRLNAYVTTNIIMIVSVFNCQNFVHLYFREFL